MTDLNTSWQDNNDIFDLQLQLNQKQLSNVSHYPVHWNDFLELLSNNSIYNILDIGCGCGVYYKLIKSHFSYIQYTGIDYSDRAIEIAKKTWQYKNFFVKNLWELDSDYISYFDAIHLGAVLDMITNGDEALNFLLDLNAKQIILSRISFTKKQSYYEEYLAYDKVKTCKYHHNIDNFMHYCKKNNYIINYFNNVLLLEKK
jgi:trans-aconitate methyltransferase